MRSKKSLPDVQHIRFTEEGHCRVAHSTIFQKLRSYTSEEYRERLGDTFHRKMDIVDSDAPLDMVGLSSLNFFKEKLFDGQAEFWIFRPSMALWSQTRQQEVYIKELGAQILVHNVKDSVSVLSTMQRTWVYFFVAVM